MCVITENKFDPNLNVSESVANAIKGFMVGTVEAPNDDDRWAVESGWAWANIPNPELQITTLLDAGWIWEKEWDSGAVDFGLTEEAVAWASDNLGLPREHEDQMNWIETHVEQEFKRQTRRSRRTPETSEVKTVSKVVKQTAYTPAEALKAIEEIDELLRSYAFSPRTAAAYKSHVTRRTTI